MIKQAETHRMENPEPVRLGRLNGQDLLLTLALDDAVTFVRREEFPKGSIIFTVTFPNNRDVKIDLTRNDHEPELQEWWTLVGAAIEFIQQQTSAAGSVSKTLYGGIPFSAQTVFLELLENEIYPRLTAEAEAASFFKRIPPDIKTLSNNELFSLFHAINTNNYAQEDTTTSLKLLKDKAHELVRARGLAVGDILCGAGRVFRVERTNGENAGIVRVTRTEDGSYTKVSGAKTHAYPISDVAKLQYGGFKNVPPQVMIQAPKGKHGKPVYATLLTGFTYEQTVFSRASND